MDIAALFADMESDLVERKRSAQTEIDNIRKAICAFANDLPNHRKPGLVIVGQENDGRCANLDVDDQLLLKLAQLKDDGKLLPFPSIEVRKEIIEGCTVAVVIVHPSDNPPVRYDNRVWIRVGPRRDLATLDEERRLVEKRQWGNLPPDARGVPGASLDDLDVVRFQLELLPAMISQEALSANNRTPIEQMKALRLLDREGRPTVAAIIVFGKEVRYWIPGAYIDARRVDGTSLTGGTLDQREISGSLIDQIREADEWMRNKISTRLSLGETRHSRISEYSLAALQQLVRNAVMHRSYEGTNAPVRMTWYDDRVEIQNPGGPYGEVNQHNFGQKGLTDYRNPTLAGLMKSLGFVERFGLGIQIAREELEKNGNPPPIFSISPTHVHVTVMKRV